AVLVTVADDDGGTDSAGTAVTANNVAPALNSLTLTPSAGDENGTVTLAGTLTDQGVLDTPTVVIASGDRSPDTTPSLAPRATPFTTTPRYLDDEPTGTPTDTVTVQVTLTDDDGGTAQSSAVARINNVAPVLHDSDLHLTPTAISEGDAAMLTDSFTDVGTRDSHIVVVRWGDG